MGLVVWSSVLMLNALNELNGISASALNGLNGVGGVVLCFNVECAE